MSDATQSGEADRPASRRAAALFLAIGLGVAVLAVAGTMWVTGGTIGKVVVLWKDAAVGDAATDAGP